MTSSDEHKTRTTRTEIRDGLRDHLPLEETRAVEYPMLANGATMGTVCEYRKDDWTWVIITDLPDETPEGVDFDGRDVVRFLILDQLPDDAFVSFEGCIGCYEYVDTARRYKHHDGAGKYLPRDSFVEKFRPLGPFHPSHSREVSPRAE